ncbi:MAG: HD domain-containing protein [Candidatus Korarchaeota archaeon]|nr:HD domain-containing protein [Candidatus Korarchaeota archaeon]NIU83701.1 HD domain-containing protein [Candidatus Thorarchaeota archaeon]NIW14886.1 HD domain-containing protein [Candidatus Thorarchaeota archaeon]NIW52018.1 HD domain-containing protein [Candidatus Korarchaeota archaeon]
MIPPNLPERYETTFKEVKDLVFETFELWEQQRVGFRWKNYLANHSLRVTSLSVEQGKREGGNWVELSFAGILHDITKPYDGDYITDANGERIVGKDGYWKNEVLRPAQHNLVTRLYDKHNLYGKVHHLSGAFIARKLLNRYDLTEAFIDNVSGMIRAHVQPLQHSSNELDQYNKVENQILADADLLDSNFGYVAFFRNLNIHAYRAQKGKAFDIEEYLENLGQWNESKQQLVRRLFLASSRKIAEKRVERSYRLYEQLKEDMNWFELNKQYGLLGMIQYFVHRVEDPNFTDEITFLRNHWIPTRQKWISKGPTCDPERARRSLARVMRFVKTIEAEAAGKA